MSTNCSHCQTNESRKGVGTGLLTSLLLAILPKCPFCVMAFSSTAMLCGEGIVMEVSSIHNSTLTIVITAILGLITILSVVLNPRGPRTILAILFSLVGISMILFSVWRSGGQPLYYAGLVIVFIGVWMNGSLFWFGAELRKYFRSSGKNRSEQNMSITS